MNFRKIISLTLIGLIFGTFMGCSGSSSKSKSSKNKDSKKKSSAVKYKTLLGWAQQNLVIKHNWTKNGSCPIAVGAAVTFTDKSGASNFVASDGVTINGSTASYA